jgi:hypothetical protein
MSDYRRGEHRNPPCSFNVAPTSLQCWKTLDIEDYRLKCGKGRAISYPAWLFDN